MSVIGIIVLGTLIMTPLLLLCNKYYKLPLHMILICAAMLVVTGMIGGSLMYFIESGKWGNQSFYGAILFAPPMMYLVTKVLGISSGAILDMSCTIGCLFLAVQKVNCMRAECCIGRIIGYTVDGTPVRFPSQIIEGAVALLICIFLFWLITKETHKGRILPWFLVLYGSTRFVLNLMRETTPFLFGLAPGNVWSIVAVIEGIIFFILKRLKKTNSSEDNK